MTGGFGFTGVVASSPVVVRSRPGPERLLRISKWLLFAVLVVLSPELGVLIALLLFPLVLIGFLFGFRSVLALFGLATLLRSRAVNRDEPPALSFRCNTGAGATREVRITGHDTGVHLGDTVSVVGAPVNGVVHAVKVRNHHTGAVLWRHRTFRLVLLAALNAWLLAAIMLKLATL